MVQALPSASQGLVLATEPQPFLASQPPVVHGFLSLQSCLTPAEHLPALQ